MAFIDSLMDLLPSVVTVHSVSVDKYGDVSVISSSNKPCYVEGKQRTIIDSEGKQVVSTLQVYVRPEELLTIGQHRYTLPDSYQHRDLLEALSVQIVSDETGPAYQVVAFR